MSYSIVEDGVVISSGNPRPKRIGNTFIGVSSNITQFGYYPEVGTKPTTEPFEEAVVDGTVLNGGVVEITYRIEQLPPPHSITRRQGKQQLVIAELDELVESAIQGITDNKQRKLTRIWYDDAETWERDNPQLLSLATALNLTEEQVDDLFRAASQL